jgi:hypothetical protein
MNQAQKQFSGSREGSKSKSLSLARRTVGALCILAVCLVASSCKKRELINANVAGALKLAPTKFADAIPDDYGSLIGVTQNSDDPAWVSLWFQKPDRTITAVFVNINLGTIYEKALTIPRK